MSQRIFFDTNILIYALAPQTDRLKTSIAAGLLLTAEPVNTCISTQVLGELYNVLLRKFTPALTPDEIQRILKVVRRFQVEGVDENAVLHAIRLQQRFQVSYWDALILASADRCSAEILYTEDLNHGQQIDAVKIVNPFL